MRTHEHRIRIAADVVGHNVKRADRRLLRRMPEREAERVPAFGRVEAGRRQLDRNHRNSSIGCSQLPMVEPAGGGSRILPSVATCDRRAA